MSNQNLATAEKGLAAAILGEQYYLFAQSSPDPILLFNYEGMIVYVNPAFTDIFGWRLDDVQMSVERFVPEAELQLTQTTIARLLDGNVDRERFETQRYTKNGRLLDVEVSATRIIDDKERPAGVVFIRDISDRKAFERQIRQTLTRRNQQVEISTQIAQEIAAVADLTTLYNKVVTLTKEKFDYYYTQLLLYNATQNRLILVEGYGDVGDKMKAANHAMPMGVGLIGVAAATGKSILIPDVHQDENWRPNPLLPHTKSELAVPIKLDEVVLGVLDVQSDETGSLDTNDQLTLEGLCGQIAIAIDSTNLRQQMEERLEELSSLQRFMTRDGWQEYQQKEKELVPGYIYNKAEVQPWDVEATKVSEVMEQYVTRPLQVRGETIGTLVIEDDPDKPLSGEDEAFVTAVSQQVAEALESVRLLEQTQDALTVQERLSSELRTVSEVGTVTSTIMEVNDLLQTVVDLTKSRFGLYHAHIYLINNRRLDLRAGADEVGRLMTLEAHTIPMNAKAIVAQTARSRQETVVNDTRNADNFLPHPLLPKTRSELAVPMVVGDTLIGVLDVQSDRPNRFGEQEVLTMRTLASQIAVAVQNAEQYAEQVDTAHKLREVDKLKSEFLASMSHELRTPLNSIIGFADVLLEGIDGELNDRMEQDVRLIRDSGDHLRNLIGDILDMSKIEAGRMELRYEDLDMRQLAQDIVAAATPLAQRKNLDILLNISNELPIINADRTRLRQVFTNIMGNAIKFTEKGHVAISLELQETDMLVSIQDTGIGIKPENVPIVFEQFRQVDGALNRKVGGTGLGMPISKNLVELHGGRIWVESIVGVGTTFWFTIPVHPDYSDRPEQMKNIEG